MIIENESIVVNLYRKYPALRYFEITNAGNFIYLNLIQMDIPQQGFGTIVMREFCEWLDKVNMPCRLTPDSSYGVPIHKLWRWYESFGFTHYDEVEMVRYPKDYPQHQKLA